MSHHHGRRARRGPSLLAGSALAFFALLGLGALVTGCQVTNSNYCCSNAASCGDGNAVSACADPARPYCDDSGRLAPVIYTTFPLDRAADAHKLMESSAHIGKIVLTV